MDTYKLHNVIVKKDQLFGWMLGNIVINDLPIESVIIISNALPDTHGDIIEEWHFNKLSENMEVARNEVHLTPKEVISKTTNRIIKTRTIESNLYEFNKLLDKVLHYHQELKMEYKYIYSIFSQDGSVNTGWLNDILPEYSSETTH